jgi:hypothetical protein
MNSRLFSLHLAVGGLLATSLVALGASYPHPSAPPQSNRNSRTDVHYHRPVNNFHEGTLPLHNPANRPAEGKGNREERTNENPHTPPQQQPGNQNPSGAKNQNSNENAANGNAKSNQNNANSSTGQGNASTNNGTANGNPSNGHGNANVGNGSTNGNQMNGQSTNKRLEMLEEASFELRSAYATLAKINENGANPKHSIEKAIHHIESAMEHHQSNQMNQNRSGVSGAISTAAHHKHHNDLAEALHEARSAHKHLGTGHVTEATEAVAHAHRHLERAISGHQALMGR